MCPVRKTFAKTSNLRANAFQAGIKTFQKPSQNVICIGNGPARATQGSHKSGGMHPGQRRTFLPQDIMEPLKDPLKKPSGERGVKASETECLSIFSFPFSYSAALFVPTPAPIPNRPVRHVGRGE
ncbi:hypothetical protein VCV18_001430 [Metarhizium anisopliae]